MSPSTDHARQRNAARPRVGWASRPPRRASCPPQQFSSRESSDPRRELADRLPALPGALLALAALALSAFAGNTTESQPRSAAEELQAFQAADGLQVDLVAAEPLVESPCALAFDERGRLFVAENRGYPTLAEGAPLPGRIAMLEDTDGDGRMDKRTTFAEGLTFPNGVLPWQGGLIVTCAPDILFLEDTDGDGKADKRTVLLTGFDTAKSTQLRVNKPTLGPDGWIYFAAGLSGGTITSPQHPEMPAVKMTGDLRWNPRTGEFQNVDGRSQYGISFDDWGNRFICMNRIQVQHVVLSSRDLKRNPLFAFSDTVQNCPELIPNRFMHSTGGAARLYPISANITTADSHAGTFSAACGVMIWRGGALPAEYRGCAISCDPTGNLVHIDKLEPKGATFAAVPLLGEQKRELLASRDDWTRPVFVESGPDGALYVCDMYRRVIEHPDYLSEEIRKRTNFEGGKDLGRIWRVSLKGTPASASSALLKDGGASGGTEDPGVSSPELYNRSLVHHVAKGDGWTSAIGFQILSQVVSAPENARAAEAVAAAAHAEIEKASPSGRAGLLRLLALFHAITPGDLQQALQDHVAGVRQVAFRLAQEDPEWQRIALAAPPAPEAPSVEFQRALLLSRADTPADLARCAALLASSSGDRWTEAAVLSACPGQALELVKAIRAQGAAPLSSGFLMQAGRLVGAEDPKLDPATFVKMLAPLDDSTYALVSGFCEARKGATARLTIDDPDVKKLVEGATDVRDVTRVALLAHAPWEIARPALLKAVDDAAHPEIVEAALRAMSESSLPEITTLLLTRARWDAANPSEREALLGALLSRPQHLMGILDAIERKEIPASAIPTVRRAAFAKSKDTALRERAAQLFSEATGDRQKVFEAAKEALALTPNGEHGHQLFLQICATCHRLNREGNAVGPDLFDIRNQPKENILFHIIIPDAEIAPAFTAYLAETKDGRTLAGLLASETTTSVTIRMPLAQEETILRTNLAKLTALPNSLMPTGLDAAMSKQDLADLVAYLKGER